MIVEAIWLGEFSRLRPCRRAWVTETEWFAPYPPGYPNVCEEAMTPVYEFYAFHWPGEPEITEVSAPDPIDGVVLYRDEFRQWALGRDLPLPEFWGDFPSDTGDDAGLTALLAVSTRTMGSATMPRPRGRRPIKRTKIVGEMLSAINSGELTPEQLRDMLEKTMETKYGVSRDTARKARKAVLEKVGR